MPNLGRSHEQTFNEALARALRRSRVVWQENRESILVERTGLLPGNQRADILILDGTNPPVAIEASYNASDADSDALKRLGTFVRQTLEIQSAIAVHAPANFRSYQQEQMEQALSAGEEIHYALFHQSDEDNNGGVSRTPAHASISGTVSDLAQVIRTGAASRFAISREADFVANLVNDASFILESALSIEQQNQIAQAVNQKSILTGTRTTMVLWLNALLTQQRLSAKQVAGAPPLDFNDPNPVVSEQVSVWRAIVSTNWTDIFEPAIDSLADCGNMNPSASSRVLRLLKQAVERIEIANLGLQLNVGAELFPKLSDDRKESAAFYTQPSIAELLSALTIRKDDLSGEEWSSASLFSKRRIADLACGTGTLLRAGFQRVSAMHEDSGGTRQTVARIHNDAMERGIIGTDISPIAAHLTMSSLAALGHGEAFGSTQISWVGVGDGPGWTGSLEYLVSDQVTDLLGSLTGVASGDSTISRASHRQSSRAVSIPNTSIDWILMNPPYSRTRGGQSAFDVRDLSMEQRRATQKRWGDILQGKRVTFHDGINVKLDPPTPIPANKKAGMGASFVALAARKLKPGGRMGFVLPLSAAFADSWKETRAFIEKEFVDIVAVTIESGKAIGSNALSADTNINEMLLIGKRNDSEESTRSITCVTLHEAPMQCGVAAEVAKSILVACEKVSARNPVTVVKMGNDIGQCVEFDVKDGKPWSSLGVVHGDLALATEKLKRGKFRLPSESSKDHELAMCTIDDLFDVGPTHDIIGHLSGKDPRGAYEFHPVRNAIDALGAHRSLWQVASGQQNQLVVLPTHKGFVATNDERLVERINASVSTCFYARNMRWTSQALLCGTTERPVLGGSSWVSIAHPDERILKCFALWANSIFGMLVHWSQGQRTQHGRARTQVGAVKKIPCPNLPELSNDALAFGASSFDELCEEPLLPACQAHVDTSRQKIDQIVSHVLDIKENGLSDLRLMWCAEPSVHGHNRKAIRLLDSIGA